MGVEFSLYHLDSKTFIQLGKVSVERQVYQTSDRTIVAFLASKRTGQFQIVPDYDDMPEEREEGWQEIEVRLLDNVH